MKNIGLDFGTTNSIIAYYNSTNATVENFEHSSMEKYIPSYLAISKDDEDSSIGGDAKSKMGNDTYDVYSKFKMLLQEKDPEILEEFDWPENSLKTPLNITEDYISFLIDDYCSSQKISKNDLENFTVTVPEIWLKDGNHMGRESLLKICEKIIGKPVKLVSEPVAASAYYAYQYNKKEGKPFTGHLLVCDFGGGTLDISLSELSGTQVKILESSGAGKLTHESLGAAGVAYDEAIVQHVYEENNYKTESKEEHYENILNFEYKKINQKSTLDKQIPRYLKENSRDKTLFKIHEQEYKPSHLCTIFEERIKGVIDDKLNEISHQFDSHGVDVNDPNKFRVLLVGGFCNFYLVEKTIMDFFGSVVSSDFRFDSTLVDADKNLAIAKGAAILSAGLIVLDTIVPLTIGVTTYDNKRKQIDKIYLNKGVSLEEVEKPKYENALIELPHRDALKNSLELFIDSESGHLPFELTPLDQYLPNPHWGNKWQLAFSMDENRCYYIHIKDHEKGKENKFRLGDLLEHIK